MNAETEVWQLETHDGVYQADLPTLKLWVVEGLVQPTDRVRKGSLKWIEAERAPALRRVFTGEEIPEAAQQTSNTAAIADTQHAHTALGESHVQTAAPETHAHIETTRAHVETMHIETTRTQDLGLSASGSASPFTEEDAQHGFIEAVSTKDFLGVLPDIAPESSAAGPAPASPCVNHPAEVATLICRTCRETFCRTCPNRMGTSSVLLCPSCGNFCDPLEDINERLALYERAGSGFGFEDFAEALAYPFKHLGSLIGGAFIYSICLLGGLWGHLLAPALVFGCISLVIHRVAYGRMDRDFLPDFSEFSIWDDMIVPYFMGWAVTIVSLGPILLLIGVLIFGLFGGIARPSAPPQPQGLTDKDWEVMKNGGSAEEEAELKRKMDGLTPSGQIGRQVEEMKQRQRDDSTLGLVRTLLSNAGLLFFAALLALAWAVFYHPMALLVAGWTESLKSTLNPLVGLDTMRHMGANYFKAFAMYLAVQVAALVLDFAVSLATSSFDMPFVGNLPARFIGGFITFYTSLVIACVLGLSLFKSSDRLGIELD